MAMRVIKARHGSFLCLDNDIYIGRSLVLLGEFSELEWALLRQLVGPGAVVVEAGANIGALTVPLAKAVGPEGRVYAFEPQRLVHHMLCGTLALNELENVYPFALAVGEEMGQVHIPSIGYGEDANFGGVALDSEGDVVTVATVDTMNLQRLDLLKVDVEGFEERVLRGAHSTIGRFRPALYIENDRRDQSPALLTYLAGLGYDAFWHLPPLFNPDNFFRHRVNPFGDILSINVLALPKEKPRPALEDVVVYHSQNVDEWPLT